MRKSLKAKLIRAAIRWAMRRPARDRIPLTGTRAQSVDCYEVELRNDEAPYQVLVDGLDETGVNGRFWNEDAYNRIGKVENGELNNARLIITHYIKTYSFRYESPYRFIVLEYTRFPYIYIFADKIRQYIFNIKPMMMRSRYDLLKWMIKCHVERSVNNFSEFQIMNDLYSNRWARHPQQTQTRSHLRLILNSLADSGDLVEIDRKYQISGRAITTITEYEAAERRNRNEVRHRNAILILTFALVLVGAIQILLEYGNQLYEFYKNLVSR